MLALYDRERLEFGIQHRQIVLVPFDSWSPTPANFELGDGIARARLWYQLAGNRQDGGTYSEAWRFN